jgi:hypothetical protein
MIRSILLLSGCLLQVSFAQFPPPRTNIKTVQSKFGGDISISYKQVRCMIILNSGTKMRQTSICETTPGVNAYSGYVHFPAGTLEDVNITQTIDLNMFFWFFESRKNPSNAPLRYDFLKLQNYKPKPLLIDVSMWLNGVRLHNVGNFAPGY